MKHCRIPICMVILFALINGCLITADGKDCEVVYYKDFDRDRFSDGITSCSQEVGFYPAEELISTFGDCDDSDNNVYPKSPTDYCQPVQK